MYVCLRPARQFAIARCAVAGDGPTIINKVIAFCVASGQLLIASNEHQSGQYVPLVVGCAISTTIMLALFLQHFGNLYLEASGQCRRPGQCARVQIKLQAVRLRAARLRGRVRAARLRRAGLQAAGCKAAGCRLQSCKAAGCKL